MVMAGTVELETALISLAPLQHDAIFFIAAAHHEPGDVLKEQQRDVLLVAQLDELRAFAGPLRHQYSVVPQDAHRKAVNVSEAGDQVSGRTQA